MADHDNSYKNLFSHAPMVEDLLKGLSEKLGDFSEEIMLRLNQADEEQIVKKVKNWVCSAFPPLFP